MPGTTFQINLFFKHLCSQTLSARYKTLSAVLSYMCRAGICANGLSPRTPHPSPTRVLKLRTCAQQLL